MVRNKTNNRKEKGGFIQKGIVWNLWFCDGAYGCIITEITEINCWYKYFSLYIQAT